MYAFVLVASRRWVRLVLHRVPSSRGRDLLPDMPSGVPSRVRAEARKQPGQHKRALAVELEEPHSRREQVEFIAVHDRRE